MASLGLPGDKQKGASSNGDPERDGLYDGLGDLLITMNINYKKKIEADFNFAEMFCWTNFKGLYRY